MTGIDIQHIPYKGSGPGIAGFTLADPKLDGEFLKGGMRASVDNPTARTTRPHRCSPSFL